MIRLTIEELKKNIKKVLLKLEYENEDIEKMMNYIKKIKTNGIKTHGLMVLNNYLKKVKKKNKSLEIIKESLIFSKIDAKDMNGIISGIDCMRYTINKAKERGIHMTFVKGANTYGAGFYFTNMATDEKMIGITFCNSPVAMPYFGGNKNILGTNPFAIGIPGKKEGPILFDMATSVVAKSKINEYRKKNEKIPLGWAVDSKGNPTQDPIEAIKGGILPMAGYKGAGLAMTIDILAGVLSNSSYSVNVNKFYSDMPMDVGQVFIVIDPSQIYIGDFFSEIDNYIDILHTSGENVYYPGERKKKNILQAKEKGIEILKEVYEELKNIINE